MFAFDPADPYPLLPLVDTFRMGAKDHSRAVDHWLGFRLEAVEETVRRDKHSAALAERETWAHLDPQVFLTPYVELRAMLERLEPAPGTRLVDLGAGYCRLAFVLARHFEGVEFTGIECAAARVTETQRVMALHDLQLARVECADLTARDFALPLAQIYFIYDCGTRDDVSLVIDKLKSLRRDGHPFTLVARGGRVRELIDRHNPWLSVGRAPEHNAHYSIYFAD